jgi:hypothetical protein
MNETISLNGAITRNRHDVYGPVHRGLRRAQGKLLADLGATDFDSEAEIKAITGRMRQILELARLHLSHEDKHVHTRIHARSDGGTEGLDDQHKEHRETFRRFADMLDEIERATGPNRVVLGKRLYLDFAAYVGDDLQHMNEEETVTWPLLCSLYSDEELIEMEGQIVGSLTPEQTMAFMSIIVPAMNKTLRAEYLGGMKANAPAEAFNAVIEHAVRPNLSAGDFADLSTRLGL